MSQQIIDTSGTTDTLPSGMNKVNSNFTEVYASLITTGMVIDYFGSTAPSGWVLLNGGTIGKSGSGASTRANDDTESLFVLLWNSISNTYAPVSSGRGASAAADFAAGKTITIPDARGRTLVSKDASNFGAIGLSVGSETITIGETNLPSHSHSTEIPFSVSGAQNGSDFFALTNAATTATSSTSVGGGTAISVIQPSLVSNKIIKL